MYFKIRDKGGSSAGQTIEAEVADFDWELFKKLPNAEEFVKKYYFAEARKFAREIHEGKNQTQEWHLQSMENLIARTLKFTKEEINTWCDQRDWSQMKSVKEIDKAIKYLKENLPKLSSSEFNYPENMRIKSAEIVAEISNTQIDPIANYLFVKLSQKMNIDDTF